MRMGNGHLLTEMGHPSDFDGGMYIRGEKGIGPLFEGNRGTYDR